MDTIITKFSSLFNNFYFTKTYGGFYPYIDETAGLIMEKLYNLYLGRFRYNNLPEETEKMLGNRNFIDGQLFFQPSVAWFKSKEYGIQVLPTSGNYKFNLVGRPVKWTVYGYNGDKWDLTEDNSVLMFNDEAMTIPFLHLMYEAGFMRDIDETAKQNIFAQRQPFIVETDEDTIKSANAEIEQLQEFKPWIFKRKKDRKSTEQIETKVFNTNTPFLIKDFDDGFTIRLNRCLTYLGINNLGVQDKKERLVVAETAGNDMLIQMYYTSAFNQRKKAIDKVNKMFGTNISFEPTELKTMQSAINSAAAEMYAMAQSKNTINDKKGDKEE